MKRFLAIVLTLALCFSVSTAAFADVEVTTIFLPKGGMEYGDYITEWHVTPDSPPDPGIAPAPEPPKPDPKPVDPDQKWKDKAHTHMKNYAKNLIKTLKREVKAIGWAHKGIKDGPVWSYETRVIMGASGRNKNPEKLSPITFYDKNDKTIKAVAYMVVTPKEGQNWKYFKKHGTREYEVKFVTEFITGDDWPYTYDVSWELTSDDQDGAAAIAEFIEYLQSLYEGAEDDDAS